MTTDPPHPDGHDDGDEREMLRDYGQTRMTRDMSP